VPKAVSARKLRLLFNEFEEQRVEAEIALQDFCAELDVAARSRLLILFERFQKERNATEASLEIFNHELDLIRRWGYGNRELKRMIGQIALYLSIDPERD